MWVLISVWLGVALLIFCRCAWCARTQNKTLSRHARMQSMKADARNAIEWPLLMLAVLTYALFRKHLNAYYFSKKVRRPQ